jgi:hypothetical protein
VGIESDAKQDLALTDDDAEMVVGGQKKSKKAAKVAKVAKPHTAAVSSAVINMSGGGWQDADANVDPNSDPDC